eukprot:12936864-Prorocentrum_lima.AAC.1
MYAPIPQHMLVVVKPPRQFYEQVLPNQGSCGRFTGRCTGCRSLRGRGATTGTPSSNVWNASGRKVPTG